MARINQRDALAALSKTRLQEIAGTLGVKTKSSHRKGDLAEALARSPRSPLGRILPTLRLDELKAICRAVGIDEKGRHKAVLVKQLLDHDPELRRRSGREEGLPTLTKADLTDEVTRATGVQKQVAEIVVGTVVEAITEALRSGSRVELRGFGSFAVRKRQGRIGRNPRTGAVVEVPSKRVVYFKPGKALRELGAGGPATTRGTQ